MGLGDMMWLLGGIVIAAGVLVYIVWTGLLINYRPRVK
jgi:hypothetical protein